MSVTKSKKSLSSNLSRSQGYFKAPDFVFELSLSRNSKLILLNLCRRADSTGFSFPSQDTIGRDCSIKSRTTVDKAIEELERTGFIVKGHSEGASNTYQLTEKVLAIIRAKAKHLPVQEMDNPCPFKGQKPVHLMDTKEYTLKETSFKEQKKFNSSLNDNSLLEEKSVREKKDLHPNGTCHKEIIDTIVGGLVHPDASHFSTPPPSSNGTSGRLPLEQAREILNTSELYRKLKQIKVFADLTPEQKAEADKQLEEIARKNQERFNGKLSQ